MYFFLSIFFVNSKKMVLMEKFYYYDIMLMVFIYVNFCLKVDGILNDFFFNWVKCKIRNIYIMRKGYGI